MSRESYSTIRILLSLLVLLIHGSVAQDRSSCETHCGGLAIPYPFGIGKGCYLGNDKWYEVICNRTWGNPVPFLASINREVVNISLPSDSFRGSFGKIQIKNPVTSVGCSDREEVTLALNITGSPYFLTNRNTLVAVGCSNRASMTDIKPQIGGCESTCDLGFGQRVQNTSCDGYKCCQAKIPSDRLQQLGIKIESLDGNTTTASTGCRVAFLTDKTYSPTNITEPKVFHSNRYSTVELGWFIDMSHNMSVDTGICYRILEGRDFGYSNFEACLCEYGRYKERSFRSCRCNGGYRGNPYLPIRCTDIDECAEAEGEWRNSCKAGDDCVNIAGSFRCKPRKNTTLAIILGFGLLVLATGGAWWLYKFIKKQREIKQKKRFFKRNEGLLLQQRLISNEDKVEKTRGVLTSEEELEKATENLSSEDRLLGVTLLSLASSNPDFSPVEDSVIMNLEEKKEEEVVTA